MPAIQPKIALIGDRDPAITAHRGIAASLEGRARFDWLMTDQLPRDAAAMRQHLAGYDGMWCMPGSPYRRMEAALTAIQVAREDKLAFLGTCGGFQHALIEYVRNVLGRIEADHLESNPATGMPVIAPLACSLVGQSGAVQFVSGSKLAAAAGADCSTESYHCSYGFNPAYRDLLKERDLTFTAFDELGEIRGLELKDHPFFLATLFQPERAALPAAEATGGRGHLHPLVLAFLNAAGRRTGDSDDA